MPLHGYTHNRHKYKCFKSIGLVNGLHSSITIKLLRLILIYHSIVSSFDLCAIVFTTHFLLSLSLFLFLSFHPVVIRCVLRVVFFSSVFALNRFLCEWLYARVFSIHSLESTFIQKSLSMFVLFMMLIASVHSIWLYFICVEQYRPFNWTRESMIIEILQQRSQFHILDYLHFRYTALDFVRFDALETQHCDWTFVLHATCCKCLFF